MKMFPAASSVLIAEQRLEQSKQQLRQRLNQVRSTLNSTLVQPSGLIIVTGIGALLGIWLARRKTAVVASGAASAWPPVSNIVFALLIRFVVRRITRSVARADEI